MHRADPPQDTRASFGPPAIFDLTALGRPAPAPPTVYYLVPEACVRDRPASWRTAVGFSLVVGGGLGLGLLLALLLL